MSDTTQPNDSNTLNALDCISRQAAIEAVSDLYWMDERLMNFKKEIDATFDKIKALPSAQQDLSSYSDRLWKAAYERGKAEAEQRWIPVKTRPMTEEERQYYSELYGYDVEYEEAIMFDCKMPEDGQKIWVCSKWGNVWQDTCEVDEGIGLEENGDWLDIAAWMPLPEPYREETEDATD